MKIPTLKGLIRRRILLNYRIDPEIAARLLPAGFRPKVHAGYAIGGICLIRLERLRPAWLPGWLGVVSENAAHRVAIEFDDPDGGPRDGVYIPRRDSGCFFNRLAGGRLFPGEHHAARFRASLVDDRVSVNMESRDGETDVRIVATVGDRIPSSSCFSCLDAASSFLKAGSLGFSETHEAGKLDAMSLEIAAWRVEALHVESVQAKWFQDPERFPSGSATFDHALLMRNAEHTWVGEKSLYV